MERCPVCDKEGDRDRPAAALKYQARMYYFSSTKWRDAFLRNPLSYVKLAAA